MAGRSAMSPIVSNEDFDECESDTATRDAEEEPLEPYGQPARDLTMILHPIVPVANYLRHVLTQCLHVHLSRWIYHMQSISRSGPNIRKAVNLFWQPAVENICEYCHRKCSDRRISVKFTWTIWKRSGTSSSPSWTRTLCRPLSTSILISVQ